MYPMDWTHHLTNEQSNHQNIDVSSGCKVACHVETPHVIFHKETIRNGLYKKATIFGASWDQTMEETKMMNRSQHLRSLMYGQGEPSLTQPMISQSATRSSWVFPVSWLMIEGADWFGWCFLWKAGSVTDVRYYRHRALWRFGIKIWVSGGLGISSLSFHLGVLC